MLGITSGRSELAQKKALYLVWIILLPSKLIKKPTKRKKRLSSSLWKIIVVLM